MHIILNSPPSREAQALLGQRASRRAVVSELLCREYSEQLEAWGRLRAVLGRDEAADVVLQLLEPAADVAEDVRLLGAAELEAAQRLVAGLRLLRTDEAEPARRWLLGELDEQEVDHG